MTALYDIRAIGPYIREGTFFVTPNDRMARAMEAAFDQQQADLGLDTWQPLAVMSLTRFIAQSLEEADLACPISASQGIYLLRRIIEEHVSASHSVSLLSPQQLARVAFQAFELVELYELSERADFERKMKSSANGTAFLQWREALIKALKKRGLATEAMQHVELCRRPSPRSWTQIVLVDFDTHTPLALRFLRTRCNVLIEHSSLDAALNKTSLDLQKVGLTSYQDKQTQYNRVAAQVRERFAADSQDRIGIVVPQLEQERVSLERALRREFNCADAEYENLPINFSAGMSASSVPLIRAGLRLLELAFGELEADELIALCHSPFCSLTVGSAERAAVGALISKLGLGVCTKQRLSVLVDELAKQIPGAGLVRFWSSVRSLKQGARPTEQVVQDFTEVLRNAGWPGERSIDSVEFQALELWRESLASLFTWRKIQSEWTRLEALSVLSEILGGRVFQPKTPDRSIQVLGTLEAGGLYFDHLFVLDADEHQFPKTVSLSPFIPVDWQREFSMPRSSAQTELRLADIQLRGFAQRSGRVEYSYIRLKDEISVRPSPVLTELDECIYEVAKRPRSTSALTYVSDPTGSPLSPELTDLKGGSYRIASQSQCAFKGYAKYRLALPESESVIQGLSPQEQGSLLHKALENLWRNRSRVEDVSDEQVPLAVRAALETLSPSRKLIMPKLVYEAEYERLVFALRAWLELERARPSFEVMALEDPVPFSLAGFTFSMRPDRIDKVGSGLFVIDYKSRAPSASKLRSDRLEEPQLPIYALALESVIGCAFGAVSSIVKPELQGLAAQAITKGVKVAEDWDDLMCRWRERLEELLNDIRQGDARVNPIASACTFCSYANVCRVRTLGLEVSDDE